MSPPVRALTSPEHLQPPTVRYRGLPWDGLTTARFSIRDKAKVMLGGSSSP
jgi:hypothetical protein